MDIQKINTNLSIDHNSSLIGKKRINDLSSNYIFRRFSTGVLSGEYEINSNKYYNLFSFNWQDEKYVKPSYHPMLNLNPEALWFYINTCYFPKAMYDIMAKKENIPERIEKLLDKLIKSTIIPNKKSNCNTKDNLFLDISTIYDPSLINESSLDEDCKNNLHNYNFNKDISIDNLIDKINNYKKELCNINKENMKHLLNDMDYDLIKDESSDLLKDMVYKSEYKNKYYKFLKLKRNENIERFINTGFRFEEDENALCSICNLGEINQYTIIINCSCCSISIHLSCYGLNEKPDDEWICDVCKLFGSDQTNKMECILCPNKGGALKMTNLRINSSFYSTIANIRSDYDNDSNVNTNNNSNIIIEIENSLENSRESSCVSKKLFSINNEYNEYAWAHVSCVLWNKEVDFKDIIKRENIINIEKISKKRFEENCYICKKRNTGPTVKCADKCNIRFHVECARLAKFSLEVNIKDKPRDNTYYILCHKHSQIELVKEIEARKEYIKENIIKFSENLGKIFSMYEKIMGYSILEPIKPKFSKLNLLKTKKKKIEKNIEKMFVMNKTNIKKYIENLKNLLKNLSNPNIILKKSDKGFEREEVLMIKFKYNDIISDVKFPWDLVNTSYSHYTNFEVFIRIFPNELIYNKKIENDISSVEKDTKLYCYCQKVYKKGTNMFGCVNGENCVLNGWFHKKCVDDMKKKSWDEIEIIEYKCTRCKEIDNL